MNLTTILKHPVFIRVIPWVMLIWTALIIYLTTFPAEALIEARVFQYDKIGHFLIFGGWTFLAGLIQLVYLGLLSRKLYPIPIAGTVFGAFIELLQYILPYERYASWGDVFANTLGCLTAYVVLLWIRKQLKNQ